MRTNKMGYINNKINWQGEAQGFLYFLEVTDTKKRR